jgi:hypothetical protein
MGVPGGDVPADADRLVRDPLRGEVVLRHARLTRRGRPTFCSPSRAERRGAVSLRVGPGTDGKVIYPSREAAEAAARELEQLGARRLRPYLCARSRSGHYHLTTDRPQYQRPQYQRPLHERIPRQADGTAARSAAGIPAPRADRTTRLAGPGATPQRAAGAVPVQVAGTGAARPHVPAQQAAAAVRRLSALIPQQRLPASS